MGVKYLFLCGSIGVGKSFLLEKLQEYYVLKKVLFIKEYIDWDENGDNKLNEFLEGKVTALDFQYYIVNSYFEQLISRDYELIVFERHPIESLLFASQKLTIEELFKLYCYIKNMCELYKVPLPENCFYDYIENKDAEASIKEITELVKMYPSVLIHLTVDEYEQGKRLMKRGRFSDKEYLSDENLYYLRKINYDYASMSVFRYNIDPSKFYIFYRGFILPPIVVSTGI